MRKFASISKATALEVLSEPLALLLTLSAMVFAALVPALHCHQFGESSRMARDAGFSALFILGSAYCVLLAVKTVRAEMESGTVLMALAHGVSRRSFFLAKALGVYLAFLVFAAVTSCVTLVAVNGAQIGAMAAEPSGDIPRMWGLSLALASAAVVCSPVAGAVADRFFRKRFVVSSTLFALAFSFAAVFYRFDFGMASRLLPGFLLLAVPPAVLVLASAAAAFRFRGNLALGIVGVLFAISLPFLSNYWQSDALSSGGRIGMGYFAAAVLAALPLAISASLAGIAAFEGQDMTGGA